MKNTTFTLPNLGEVSLEDTVVYHDGPILFTIRDSNQKKDTSDSGQMVQIHHVFTGTRKYPMSVTAMDKW